MQTIGWYEYTYILIHCKIISIFGIYFYITPYEILQDMFLHVCNLQKSIRHCIPLCTHYSYFICTSLKLLPGKKNKVNYVCLIKSLSIQQVSPFFMGFWFSTQLYQQCSQYRIHISVKSNSISYFHLNLLLWDGVWHRDPARMQLESSTVIPFPSPLLSKELGPITPSSKSLFYQYTE